MDTAALPDPVRHKVDTRTRRIVANDFLEILPESVVVVRGETVAVAVRKLDRHRRLIVETVPIWTGLVPVTESGPALPGLPSAGTPPYGRLLRRPFHLRDGVERVVIEAPPRGSETGNDLLIVTERGLEPRFIPVIYRDR